MPNHEGASRLLLANKVSDLAGTFFLGANGSRERAPDDRLRDEAIHLPSLHDELLRFACNDGAGIDYPQPAAMPPSTVKITPEV
jgi:hypothetical protein